MQIVRGRTYLEDGAIEPWQLSPSGRHLQAVDDYSWHLLALDERARVFGCVRYLEHRNPTSFDALTLRTAALALSDKWGSRVRAAVESEMEKARRREQPYVEVGGWAISEERRCTADAARLALATFGLAKLFGGCLGVTTATTRHHSSSILRKIGGRPLEWDGAALPSYYDPQYRCEMEILRFDSCNPGQRFSAWIEELELSLLQTRVIWRGDGDLVSGTGVSSCLDAGLSSVLPELMGTTRV
ncbi:MAG TPA: hypothetical protein VHA11_01200 [Bryobacteraceae bacterium]|nr:hypothetical protein [Bryobacteraceae bacterium]